MSPWKVILATVIIFAAGVITGGVLVHRVKRGERPRPIPQMARPQQEIAPTPWFVRREFLERMDRNLNLSREQYDRIAKILQESQERTRQVFKRVGPEIQEELRHVRREIRGQLTPEQAEKFEELQREIRQRPRPPGEEMERRPPPRREQAPLHTLPRTNDP